MRLPIITGVFAVVLSVVAATPALAAPAGGTAIGKAAATIGHVEPVYCLCTRRENGQCRRFFCSDILLPVPLLPVIAPPHSPKDCLCTLERSQSIFGASGTKCARWVCAPGDFSRIP